jgi:hypothetical protein
VTTGYWRLAWPNYSPLRRVAVCSKGAISKIRLNQAVGTTNARAIFLSTTRTLPCL